MVDRTEFRQRARRVKRGGVGSSRFDDRAAFSGAMKRPGAMNDRGTNQGKSDCDLLNLVLCLLNGWCFGPGEARATSISRSGSARSEQRSLERKGLPPFGLRPVWPVASLLVGHSPTVGDAPFSRLATGQTGRNKTPAI